MILDGSGLAKIIESKLYQEVKDCIKNGVLPRLAILLANADSASAIYVKNKLVVCKRLGIIGDLHQFNPDKLSQAKLLETITTLNNDSKVHGILCQLPLPKGINPNKIAAAIDADKDVDCFNPLNIGQLFLGKSLLMPCTPQGIITILEHFRIPISGKQVVILGRSNIVGKPLALMLISKEQNATVTICHSKTADLKTICRSADILVAAIGKPKFVTADYIKPGAVVIDVGINKVATADKSKSLTLGDVDFEQVKPLASAITPVPKGVGPMTIISLMANVVKVAKTKVTTH